MTPLATRIARQVLGPVKDRTPFWAANADQARKLMEDIHCFETTQVLPLAVDLINRLNNREVRSGIFENLLFLPAPKTWVEFKSDLGRVGFLIVEPEDGDDMGQLYAMTDDAIKKIPLTISKNGNYRLTDSSIADDKNRHETEDFFFSEMVISVESMLILINSPRIIGRRQNMPDRRLERLLLKNRKQVGKFPLHAWTEIKLQVNKPPQIEDGEPHEAHLTGKRALHFCRKHIRIRNHQLEYVSAHWRGDPAIGIKQSRYVVTP